MKKASIIGAIAFGASLLFGIGGVFAQTETPSPTQTPTTTTSPSPTGSVQGSSTVPQGAPATGRG